MTRIGTALVVIVLASAALGQTTPASQSGAEAPKAPPPVVRGLDLSAIDQSAATCTDFCQYACEKKGLEPLKPALERIPVPHGASIVIKGAREHTSSWARRLVRGSASSQVSVCRWLMASPLQNYANGGYPGLRK
jgi:hypothetical protein